MNAQIHEECLLRGITRLCHFTQSRNLAHILADQYGLLSTRTLKGQAMPHSPTDPQRYDGHDDLICCSIEYPNVYYFSNARKKDILFRDWVVLLIKPDYLWQEGTCFCPRNAAALYGRLIGQGYDLFQKLYAPTTDGSGSNEFPRTSLHLSCSPTDAQAEVLVREPINLNDLLAVVVESPEQAQRERRRLELQNVKRPLPFISSPTFFSTTLPYQIIKGIRVTETCLS